MSADERHIIFQENHWAQISETSVIVGMMEEALSEVSEISAVELPPENEEVVPDEIIGELITDEGPISVYSPVSGLVMEINPAVTENPALILEDPLGDGWLFRVECDDPAEIEKFVASTKKSSSDEDDEELDEDEGEDDDDDDDDENGGRGKSRWR